MKKEVASTEISGNSQKFDEHQVGIIQHRMETFRVSCHFCELSLIVIIHEERSDSMRHRINSVLGAKHFCPNLVLIDERRIKN